MTASTSTTPVRFRYFIAEADELKQHLVEQRETAAANRRTVQQLVRNTRNAEAPHFRNEKLAGLVFNDDAPGAGWVRIGVNETGRPVFRPDARTASGRRLTERMNNLRVPGRLSNLRLLGLDGWVLRTDSAIYTPKCREVDEELIVRIPETDAYPAPDHPWLTEISRADFHDRLATEARREERISSPE